MIINPSKTSPDEKKEENYIVIEQPRLDTNNKHITEDDYILVPRYLYHYEPSQINKMLQVWLREKKEHTLSITDHFANPANTQEIAGWIVDDEQKGQKKIALFKVARIPYLKEDTNIQNSILDIFLNAYINKNIPCKKLIIPIEESGRKHFRLLVIKPEEKIATFYDSKSRLASQPQEIVTSALSAYYAEENKPFYKLPSVFVEKYNYVENICKKHFPGIQFTKSYLGHQQYYGTNDCTPYVVEYAFNETSSNTELNELKIKVNESRAKHSDLFFKNVDARRNENTFFSQKVEKNPNIETGIKIDCKA